jgi:integrase
VPYGEPGPGEEPAQVHVIDTWLGAVTLKRLTREVIERRLRELEAANAAPASVEHLRRKLRAIFNAARLPQNPAAQVRARPSAPMNPRGTLTAEEVVRMLRAAHGWGRNLLALAAYLALRKGEALALRQSDVDLDEGAITVRRSHARSTTKGGHVDTLPTPAPLRPFIVNQLALARGSELLFPDADGRQHSRLPRSPRACSKCSPGPSSPGNGGPRGSWGRSIRGQVASAPSSASEGRST